MDIYTIIHDLVDEHNTLRAIIEGLKSSKSLDVINLNKISRMWSVHSRREERLFLNLSEFSSDKIVREHNDFLKRSKIITDAIHSKDGDKITKIIEKKGLRLMDDMLRHMDEEEKLLDLILKKHDSHPD